MSLEKYVKKRDFSKTKEPGLKKAKLEAKAGKKAKATAGKKLTFVVQRHHASHLHYDFRLEMQGVLKSWAVPKGPSLNPKDKRLAMMVEDHPYEYRTFEGEIPAGNYGGGTVHIFDKGTYQALEKGSEKDLLKGLYAGNLKFKLNGKILKGEFALVKIKSAEDNAWLLIKHNDEYAVKGEFDSEDLVPSTIKKKGIAFKKNAGKQKDLVELETEVTEEPLRSTGDSSYKPMLAKLADHIFDDPDWIYEKKLDGYRALAFTEAKGGVKIMSRNGIDFKEKYKAVSDALKDLGLDAVIDGELVVEDKKGKGYFQKLQNYDAATEDMELKFYVFDLLSLNGHDMRGMELLKRKELLNKLIDGLNESSIIYNDHVSERGSELFKAAEKHAWEGIIGKHAHSTYSSDKRSDQWLKFKLQNSQEVIIIGFSKPEGSRKYFGSIALGMYEGTELTYIGNCGTGFNEETLKDLYNKMKALVIKKKPLKEKVHKEYSFTWVKTELVAEVTYSEWTEDQHLRHPVFKGLRMDKEKDKVVKESTREETGDKELLFGRKKVKLTNLGKLYWPKEGITKGQLLAYYEKMSAYILPHLKDKALSLNRHPNGIDEPGFFQKDLDTDKIPKWIKSAPLYSESNDKHIDYLICNDEATLLWMVNLGCIEINPWLSKYKTPDHPLFAVLDLDPHDIDFKEAVKVALSAKELLDKMKLKSFIKTSGSKGLHIFIPIGEKYDYDVSKDFIKYLGQMLFDLHPDTTSLERSPSKRKNKIYLDFLQNRRGQTIAAPYSARPKPGATVSAPLEWTEVNEKLNLKDYTIFNMEERVKEKGDLWKGVLSVRNDLLTGLRRLKG
ncbi:DNA ligase D [Pedobacter frigoris]|uniref:DNA ligase (ATP) n=1 Tax=Pedobacter frigoris TaxID=2571272 RepID=A0A4U1CBK8_9SPHI|nr:DNA ligase D [Pedobacter frigoris]TKC03953.1 DNA ligase D [Pedobacter frigoris]